MVNKSTEAAHGADAMQETAAIPEDKLARVSPEDLKAVQKERRQDTGNTDQLSEGGGGNGIIEPLLRNGAPQTPMTDASDEPSRATKGIGDSTPNGSNLGL